MIWTRLDFEDFEIIARAVRAIENAINEASIARPPVPLAVTSSSRIKNKTTRRSGSSEYTEVKRHCGLLLTEIRLWFRIA